MKLEHIVTLNCALAGLLLAGCAQQQQTGRHHRPPPAATAGPKAVEAALLPSTGYGPSYSTFEENGLKWVRGSMAFPTGRRESSGLLLEKTVPAEVMIGQKFDYAYKVSNLTDYPIQMVTVADRVSPNFTPADSEPKANETREGIATWQLGNLGPQESKIIHVRGSAATEGVVTTCGWASYSPILCEDIKVAKGAMQLTNTAPAEVVICDPIPMTLLVKNTGSTTLTMVKVNDTLPEGLTSDGKQTVAFDAGDLAPGDSKEFKFNATAARAGEFANKAQASSAQGLTADASATTVVRQPVLAVSCKAPEQHSLGRPFEVSFSVVNNGDASAAGTVLEVPVQSGLTFQSASGGGQFASGKVTWDLGSLAPKASQVVTATFVSAKAGSFDFNASVKGTCAKLASSSCQSRVVAKGAKAGDAHTRFTLTSDGLKSPILAQESAHVD